MQWKGRGGRIQFIEILIIHGNIMNWENWLSWGRHIGLTVLSMNSWHLFNAAPFSVTATAYFSSLVGLTKTGQHRLDQQHRFGEARNHVAVSTRIRESLKRYTQIKLSMPSHTPRCWQKKGVGDLECLSKRRKIILLESKFSFTF